MQQQGRIEIANHAGTPEQDAFMGYMDSVRVEQSYKHPALFTITVGGYRSPNGSTHSSPQQDMSQWHLPAPDQRNDGRYMYRLHTIDIYFWTAEDSTMFLDSLRRVLQAHQLQILEAPTAHSEHRDTMSPVVEKLEQAAISKPYPSRSDSISTTQSFNGPPTVPTPASSGAGHSQNAEAPTSFAPMAYNPASPAAPEPIAHREKTPPPPDAEGGTGLAAAAIHDNYGQFGAPPIQGSFAPQPTTHQPYMPGPTSLQPVQNFSNSPPVGIQRSNTSGAFLPPPPPQGSSSAGPPQGQQYAHSFAPPPQDPASQHGRNGTPPQPGLQRQATMPASYGQYANYPGSPGHPPVQSPGLPPTPGHAPLNSPLHSPGYTPAPAYAPVASPGLPPASYSQYPYGQSQAAPEAYQIHNQLYRPTEAEAKAHGKKPVGAGPGQQPGRLEQRADKLEKGVGRFLKKLDKF